MTLIGSWVDVIAPISQSIKITEMFVEEDFPNLLGVVRLFEEQRDQIVKFVGKFNSSDIQTIGGQLFF